MIKYYDSSLYMFPDKYLAMMWFITSRYGMEPSYDYRMPDEMEFILPNKPLYGQGEYLPGRWLISNIDER